MMTILKLKTKPFRFPIASETTNIVIRAITSDENGPATVNGIEVEESFRDILFLLGQF